MTTSINHNHPPCFPQMPLRIFCKIVILLTLFYYNVHLGGMLVYAAEVTHTTALLFCISCLLYCTFVCSCPRHLINSLTHYLIHIYILVHKIDKSSKHDINNSKSSDKITSTNTYLKQTTINTRILRQ